MFIKQDKGINLTTPIEKVDEIIRLKLTGMRSRQIAEQVFGKRSSKSTVNGIYKRWLEGKQECSFNVNDEEGDNVSKLPKVLTIDIETSPNALAGWALFNQNFSIDQIEREWFILSYTAKWLHDEDVIYNDMKGKIKSEDDTELLLELWSLLDEATIVVGQNHRRFDLKKINARMIMQGITKPYSPVKTEDTMDIAKRKFGFTSNKLAWLTKHLNVDFKKQSHDKYAGFNLWKECMAENEDAWDSMREYNIFDVLSTEELWLKIKAWDDKSINFALYLNDENMMCKCGSPNLEEAGYTYTSLSKFQQYRCKDCGSYMRGRKNLFSKEKRANLLMNVINK